MSNNKTYWKGLEELHNSPEFVKNRDNEFPQEMPVDVFLADEKLKESSASRRDFLKFLGFSITAATIASCEAPVIKAIPYTNKPEEITPGVANWYATTYYDGQNFGSILVKTREGRPIFIKGNKQYGINMGATNALMTASVLGLYNEARLTGPRKRGSDEDLKWVDVDKDIREKLEKAAGNRDKVVILTNTIISPSTQGIINDFIKVMSGETVIPYNLDAAVTPVVPAEETAPAENQPAANVVPAGVAAEEVIAEDQDLTPASNVRWIQYDSISYKGIRVANEKSFGKAVIPSYDFSKAKTIVSISADFMNGWLLSNVYTAQYALNRKPENEWMSKHFQFESVMSVAGSNADVRVPIKPSQEGQVAAAIYNHLTGNNAGDVSADILKLTETAAKELKANAGSSLVIAGSNDPNVQIIVNAINSSLGNYASTINLNNPTKLFQGDEEAASKLAAELKDTKVVIIAGTNPVYTLPNGKEFGAELKKVDLSVSFSGYADETASLCSYICPDHHYLEAWNDFHPLENSYAIAQPTIRPLYDTAAMQESLLVWAGLAPRLGKDSDTYYKVIQRNWTSGSLKFTLIEAGLSQGLSLGPNEPLGNSENFFEPFIWFIHNGSLTTVSSNNQYSFSGDINSVAKSATSQKGSEFEVVFYQKAGMGDGAQANNPWLQELPDPVTKVTWDNYVTMAPVDMEGKYNTYIGQEDPASVVNVKVNGKEYKLPVFPQPGQAKGTIGIALGYGRGENGEEIGKAAYQVDEYGQYIPGDANGKTPIGLNAFKALKLSDDGVYVYSSVKADVSDAGEEYPLACTQVHNTVMGRTSIVKETSFSFYKTGKKEGEEGFNPRPKVFYDGKEQDIKDVNLWNEHPVENVGHRWGMTIDLNTCIGCGNCLVSCQAENNVPVVGKDEVRRGREMHWLRLDRYYSSDATREDGYSAMEVPSENPEVVFMPMMCHHCNHAPCETVCPVAATTHSNEGLNQMAYNRCIGTRYCANNCPYKVRRFNWFAYPSYKKFTAVNPSQHETGRLVLNPDVVVRTRGVMEKCSMCVQSIQAGKLQAKKEGRPVNDSDINTACAEACPTNAIIFGDWNDTESAIRKSADSDRSYQALEEVGVKPNIWYKVKVRNINEKKNEA